MQMERTQNDSWHQTWMNHPHGPSLEEVTVFEAEIESCKRGSEAFCSFLNGIRIGDRRQGVDSIEAVMDAKHVSRKASAE